MEKFLSVLLALSLVSVNSFAEKKSDRSRPANPDRDRGGERGSSGSRGNEVDGGGDQSPDWGGGGRESYSDVDRGGSGTRGGAFVDRRDIHYVDKFLALRDVFQSVDPESREEIRQSVEPKVAFWAVVASAAAATWTYIKKNPAKSAVRGYVRTTTGVAAALIAYSATAAEGNDAIVEADLFNLFDSKFWKSESVRYALRSDYRPQIEAILDNADSTLCSAKKIDSESIRNFCELP